MNGDVIVSSDHEAVLRKLVDQALEIDFETELLG
jgi:hypothetical protein